MACFYYTEEPHLDMTEMTVCHSAILDFKLGSVIQRDIRMVSQV